jgi:hypothetical protein
MESASGYSKLSIKPSSAGIQNSLRRELFFLRRELPFSCCGNFFFLTWKLFTAQQGSNIS